MDMHQRLRCCKNVGCLQTKVVYSMGAAVKIGREGPVNPIIRNANAVKTAPIKARDDGKAPALPRSATLSGAVFTPFPVGCDQKGRARRSKALMGSTPSAFCALRTALLTHNASPENGVNRPYGKRKRPLTTLGFDACFLN